MVLYLKSGVVSDAAIMEASAPSFVLSKRPSKSSKTDSSVNPRRFNDKIALQHLRQAEHEKRLREVRSEVNNARLLPQPLPHIDFASYFNAETLVNNALNSGSPMVNNDMSYYNPTSVQGLFQNGLQARMPAEFPNQLAFGQQPLTLPISSTGSGPNAPLENEPFGANLTARPVSSNITPTSFLPLNQNEIGSKVCREVHVVSFGFDFS